jgi:hypothetical protein
MLGIRLSAVYSSLRRFTKSTSNPSILTFVVSKCFDCSGLLAIVVPVLGILPSSASAWAKACPVMVESAISISLHSIPNSYNPAISTGCPRGASSGTHLVSNPSSGDATYNLLLFWTFLRTFLTKLIQIRADLALGLGQFDHHWFWRLHRWVIWPWSVQMKRSNKMG